MLEPPIYEINEPEPDISTLTPFSVVSEDISNEDSSGVCAHILQIIRY